MDKWSQLGGAGSCGLEPAGERQLEVVRWIEQLGYITERLGGITGELEVRLEPAMGPNAENQCSDKALQPACSLSGEIQSRVSRLSEIESRIASILRRLEF